MMTFSEKEDQCVTTFDLSGPYWHVFSSGKETPIIFTSEEDLKFVMNTIAFCVALCFENSILAFSVMNNHFHFVVSAQEEEIMQFWICLRRKLHRFFPIIGNVKINLKIINDLGALRNTIVYVHRNGYLVSPEYTPFSYPWGTGMYYFLNPTYHEFVNDISMRRRRVIFRARDVNVPKSWFFNDGYVVPSSYCNVKLGRSMFRDAHHYFYMISKNVEVYSGISEEIDAGEFLTDIELYGKVMKTVREQYGLQGIRDLSSAQKKELAKAIHYDYRSSNEQISRILGVSIYEINKWFPILG